MIIEYVIDRSRGLQQIFRTKHPDVWGRDGRAGFSNRTGAQEESIGGGLLEKRSKDRNISRVVIGTITSRCSADDGKVRLVHEFRPQRSYRRPISCTTEMPGLAPASTPLPHCECQG